MIEQEKIDRIKATVDMIALAEAKGVHMKKNGRGYFGLCPFHNDKNPSLSINPKTNLWQCFGCGAGGDVIRFIELFDGVDFSEAVRRLSDNGFHQRPADDPPQKALDKPTPPLTTEQIKLLTRVIEFYHTAFAQSPQAGEYLTGRGITEKSLYADYKLGLADGRLLDTLPKKGGIKDQLKELGILNQKGTEHFYGCLVFPVFNADNNPCGLYGRRIQGAGADHLYLPGERKGVFNWQAAKAHKEIILTESIIDSLTLINAGIKNTIPCYGVNGLTQNHMELFRQQKTESILICFDADEPGRKAAQEIKQTLETKGIQASIIDLPDDQDINEFFLLTADPLNHFKAVLPQTVQNQSPAVKKEISTEEKDTITKTDFGFVLTTDGRTYEVRGLCRRDNKLKATVKGIRQDGAKKRLHIDTVDFYSARSRAYLVKGLCDLFGVDDPTITRDIETLLARAEQYHQPENRPDEQKPAMTDKERAEALRFLKNPSMFDEILTDIETLGYTGEEMNKLLCYVAAVSRKMDSPLSVMIQSRSAAGKSFLQDTILSLIPEEDKTKYTRLTDQALFYTDRHSLKHKILAIEELDGMNGAIYSVRSIQSSKQITIAYTGKDPATGEQKTLENVVEGPLMVFITTTQVDIDGETASRFVFISIDESEPMTRKVLEKQRQAHTITGMLNKLKSDGIVKKHQNANRLLKPLYVFNPYAELLTFTSKSLRARRDHTKYLNLISAVAYLFQYQRERRTIDHDGKTIDYINVTLDDIEKANLIANHVLGRSLDELPPPSRALLKLIQEMCARHTRKKSQIEEYHFTRKDIREFCCWSDFQVRTHIRQLEDLEYVYSVAGKRGKEYVYELVCTKSGQDDQPFLIGLTDIDQLKQKAEQAGISD